MYLKNAQFDHNQENINLAFGLSKQQEIIVRERIVFHIVNHHLNIIDHIKDTDVLPRKDRTSSGIIQKLLQDIHSPLEYEVSLYMFFKLEQICEQIMKLYHHAVQADISVAMDLVVAKLKAASIELEAQVADNDREKLVMSPINLFNRIQQVKESNGNFDEYMRRYAAMNLEPVHTDVDAILNSVFTFD